MNEQIRELADQCRTEYHDGCGGFIEQFDEEKFAELIILKCAAIVSGAVALREPASTCVSKILELKNERTR